MKVGRLHGQVILNQYFLNLDSGMYGFHKMLEAVNIYYACFLRESRIVIFKTGYRKSMSVQRQNTTEKLKVY